MKNLKSAAVRGKRVLVRVDFNVLPLEPHELRIDRTIPTLRYLLSQKAKIILLTHVEENDGDKPSVASLLPYLKKYLPMEKITLFENLRKFPGEKQNSSAFASRLAALGDFYVNEAFSVSHRRHASIVSLPKLLPSYPGFLFTEEIKNLSKVFRPPRPFVLILGGGKIDTKIPLLKKFSKEADHILLGGVAANVFLEKPPFALKNAVLPDDGVIQVSGKKKILPVGEIKDKMKIWDVGPDTLSFWEEIIRGAKLVVWNGPLGFVEKGFREGTNRLFAALQKNKNAEIIMGGGDTLAALPPRLPPRTFLSTGGGAMLEFLAAETLPGIKALE